MKKLLLTLVLCGCLTAYVLNNQTNIVNLLVEYLNETPTVYIPRKNNYAKSDSFEYVQITDKFIPYNYQELLNVFYTVLDSGFETFTFYCPSEYEDCLDDVQDISSGKNNDALATIGNFISPYNNFSYIKVQYDTAGEVTIHTTKLYSEEEIQRINTKIDELWVELIDDEMKPEDIIYTFHDYIINKTKYDENYEIELEKGTPTHNSAKAIGPLFEGFGICSGYTDFMSLILNRLNIKNYKIASNTHVWNALFINDKWLHLDLTWDDPVSSDHSINNLLHKFFLIDTETLEGFDIKDHTFNKTLYLEMKK